MQSPPILHVIVIGFHHKKGCQVEYSYPSLIPGQPLDSNEIPELWKHLPSLALPDGAHNFEKDTIYFHLPALDNPKETVFGVSCYRQMNAEKLLNKSSDITRGSVQKSVCVISTLPLYGMIQTKLELITHAYFDERDFSKVSLLEETYKNLNVCLTEDSLWGSQVFLGLSVRDLVFQFRHKVIILFKLLLLERKVLFFKSPVEDLCCSILTLCSLVPGMLEKGLKEAASGICTRLDTPQIRDHKDGDYLEVCFPHEDKSTTLVKGEETASVNCQVSLKISDNNGNVLDRRGDARNTNVVVNNDKKPDNARALNRNSVHDSEEELLKEINDYLGGGDLLDKIEEKGDKIDKRSGSNSEWYIPDFTDTECVASNYSENQHLKVGDNLSLSSYGPNSLDGHHVRQEEVERSLKEKVERMDSAATDRAIISSSTSSLLTLELDSCGLPLAIFQKGAICLPYLSLPFIDILGDVNIRSFVVGATNILFKTKRHLFDVLIEVDEGKIEIFDAELRKQLQLTIEDLRFAENLVQHISLDDKDVFLDGTGWEGGDEWLRAQFRLYLLSLLRTAELSENSREQEAFNSSFFQAWQTTHNYRVWSSCAQKHYTGLQEVEARHPYQRAQISMNDMKLKISQVLGIILNSALAEHFRVILVGFDSSMQSSEKGKKLNQAVSNTGKVVMQTGRVVGGAITSAKSFMSSWFSNTSVASQLTQNGEENEDNDPENFYEIKVQSRENSTSFETNLKRSVETNSLN